MAHCFGLSVTVMAVPSFEEVICANVRAERGRRRWRQCDLAEKLGWSISQVSDLERGQRHVLAAELVAFCQVLQIGLEDLVRGADPVDLRELGIARR